MRINAGYNWLVETYQLPAINLWQHCYIDSATRGRQQQDLGSHRIELFESRYQPEDTLPGHLQFALRYEGVNLQVLSLLCAVIEPKHLSDWVQQSPASAYARRACFLFEWLCGSELPIDSPVSPKMRYVDAVDPGQQFVSGFVKKDTRFRVTNNLPGTPQFCPMGRKTAFLQSMVEKNLRLRTYETLGRYDADLLRRAAACLYLKEPNPLLRWSEQSHQSGGPNALPIYCVRQLPQRL